MPRMPIIPSPSPSDFLDNPSHAGVETDAQRVVIERNRTRVYDVREKGCVFDGVQDETTRIQAAITELSAEGGGQLWLPPGVAPISDRIEFGEGVSPAGRGQLQTIFRADHADASIAYVDNERGMRSGDFGFNGQDSASVGVEFGGGIRQHANIRVQNSGINFLYKGAQNSIFEDIISRSGEYNHVFDGQTANCVLTRVYSRQAGTRDMWFRNTVEVWEGDINRRLLFLQPHFEDMLPSATESILFEEGLDIDFVDWGIAAQTATSPYSVVKLRQGDGLTLDRLSFENSRLLANSDVINFDHEKPSAPATTVHLNGYTQISAGSTFVRSDARGLFFVGRVIGTPGTWFDPVSGAAAAAVIEGHRQSGRVRIDAQSEPSDLIRGALQGGDVDVAFRRIAAGHVGVGANNAFRFGSMTTAERDAITTWANGDVIYNSTVNKYQGRAAGAWVDLH